jgi:DNA-binding transcriptional MerR regulator
VAGRGHLSIGEVLSLLHEEFPDVTISKIRFLESQGLVDPERTPSGYRKFYEPDIERLRWVLRQQRDAFLPLKVIKDRLEGQGDPDADEDGANEVFVEEGYVGVELATEVLYGNGGGPASKPGQLFDLGPASGGHVGPRSGSETAAASRPRASRAPAGERATRAPATEGPTGAPAIESPTGAPAAERATRAPAAERATRAPAAERTTRAPAAERATPRVQASPTPAATDGEPAERVVAPKSSLPGRVREVRAPADDELALAELVAEAGVDVETVRDLEQYGLIIPRILGGAPYYTREAAVIARLAWAFARHGVEARHLRAYKGAAEREAGLVQQVIMPLLRQRNPQAREAAAQAVDELSELGGELRAALLRAALADLR